MYYVQFVLLIMTQTVQNLPTARGKTQKCPERLELQIFKVFLNYIVIS